MPLNHQKPSDLGYEAGPSSEVDADSCNHLKHPDMAFGKADMQAAVFFLQGFRTALQSAFDLRAAYHDLQDQVIVERGWELPKATGPRLKQQMLQKGKDPLEVIEELFAIEIETVQRLTDGPA